MVPLQIEPRARADLDERGAVGVERICRAGKARHKRGAAPDFIGLYASRGDDVPDRIGVREAERAKLAEDIGREGRRAAERWVGASEV